VRSGAKAANGRMTITTCSLPRLDGDAVQIPTMPTCRVYAASREQAMAALKATWERDDLTGDKWMR
jgi:hypothetical protein